MPPTAGTANITVTLGATTAIKAGAIAYDGVNQSASTGTYASASGTSTTASVNVTSATGDLVIDVTNWETNPSGYTIGAGQTQSWTVTNATSRAVSTTEAGAASVTMSSTVSASNQWEIGAVSIQAAPNSVDVANNDYFTVQSNTATTINLTQNDTDADSHSISIIDLSTPTSGTVTNNNNGTVTYTSGSGFSGNSTFSYMTMDSGAGLNHYYGLAGNGTDSIGGQNATLNGTTTVSGAFGNGLSFNGSSDYATIGDFSYGSNFSISFSFKLDTNAGSTFQYLYSHGTVQTNNSINIYIGEASSGGTNANLMRTVAMDGNDTANANALDFSISSIVADGNWHTYTLTGSATSGLTVYLDGVQKATDTTRGKDGIDPTGSIYVGARNDLDATRYYDNKLDTLSTFNRALSSSEVLALHNATNVGSVTTAVNINPVNTVPSTQTFNEDVTLTFSSGNGNLISIADADAGASSNQVTLSVSQGTLTLSGTTGLTFVAGDGTADSTMTFRGTAANINAALSGMSYTPNSNYNGTDQLVLSTTDATLLSVNIDAGLKGRYAFENTGALGTDTSPAAGNSGTNTNGTANNDATRGNVLNLSGNGYIQSTGHFGNPANATIAAWVNLTAADSGGAEVISLGDSLLLRLQSSGTNLITAAWYNGTTWNSVTYDYGTNIAGTGWHHVALTFNDTGNAAILYLDGVQVASTSTTDSIAYTQGANSFIGKHGNGQTTYDFSGSIDDARVYNRVLTAAEVASLAGDIDQVKTSTVSLTINAVNDAPTITNGYTHTLTTTSEDTTSSGTLASAILTGASLADVDSGALSGLAITAKAGNGTWQYSTDGTTWNSFGSVSSTNALLITSSTQVRYIPDGNNGETATFSYKAWDQTSGTASTNSTANYATTASSGGSTAFSSNSASAQIVVSSVNDAPTITNGYTYGLSSTTEDSTSTGTLASAILTGASRADVDSGAVSGLAITAKTGNGTWQYSTDGSTWNSFGAVSSTNALLITSTTQVRYIPDGNNGETATFSYKAWDQTSGTASTNGTPSYATTASSGGTTAFSSNTASAQIVVSSVNDAPTITNGYTHTLTATTEDATSSGTLASAILTGASRADVDSGAVSGLAFTA
ncbi:MAG: LamG-like jellyroll fold domain-containing protein, partial [Pirellulales bacterium]